MGDELKMDEQFQEDWLDAKLREEAPYLDDAGFTARVAQQLPPRRQSSFLRAVILLGLTLIACVIAYFVSGGGEVFANAAAYLVALPFNTVCVIAGSCALLVMVLGASAALRGAEQRSLGDLARSIR